MAQTPRVTAAKEPPFRTRLQVVFASAAPKAVILRRGPKRHFNLITWDLETDSFGEGQWMKGIVNLCDLSPSGERLLYWAAQYHASALRDEDRSHSADISRPYDPLSQDRFAAMSKKYNRRKMPAYLRPESLHGQRGGGECRRWKHPPRPNQGVWTAISRPPYFSALAIWPCFGHWTGGGLFRDEDNIVLWESADGLTPVENTKFPASVNVQSFDDAKSAGNLSEQWAKKPDWHDADSAACAAVVVSLEKSGVRWIDFVRINPGKDLLFGCDGCVYRLENWQGVGDGEHLAKADLLADFTKSRFRMMRTPAEAMRW